jgi:hypothetical protein
MFPVEKKLMYFYTSTNRTPMESFSVTVPCKSYVAKYFNKVYGEFIPLDHRSDFADTILTKMVTTPLAQINNRLYNLEVKHYDSKLKFKLKADFYFRVEPSLTTKQIYNINRYLENVLESDLFIVVCMAQCFGVQNKTAMRAFCDKYDIILDEDISLSALKQAFYRYKNTPIAKNFFLLQLSSPHSSLNLRA